MRKTKTPEITPERIAAAAVRCFRRYGPQRTSMADISDEAGISRQSVYRFFEDRSALIEFVLNKRIAEMARKLGAEFPQFDSLEEALVEGSLLSNRFALEDKLFTAIISTSLDRSVELFLLRGSPEINAAMLSYWGPLLDTARAQGRLRSGVTNDQILEWLRHVHSTMMLRSDQSEDVQRAILKNFLVPAIIRD